MYKRRIALARCTSLVCFIVVVSIIPFDIVIRDFKVTKYKSSIISRVTALFFPLEKSVSFTNYHTNCDGNTQKRNITSNVTLKKHEINISKYLIIQIATGRLGNQMFDFASALGVANALNYTFVMRRDHPLLDYFEINYTVVETLKNVKGLAIEQWRDNTWDRTYLSHNLTLVKWWRVYRYFNSSAEEIRKSLKIKHVFLSKAKTFLMLHNPNGRTLVGVHVRRGDYLDPKQERHGRVVVDIHYLNKAMALFRKTLQNVVFIVVSDDISWCRDNMAEKDVVFSIFTEPIIDMAILSLCNHTIMSTGTFSWWGAWLAGGMVVYCSDFPRRGSDLAMHAIFRDSFYPPTWVGLSNGK